MHSMELKDLSKGMKYRVLFDPKAVLAAALTDSSAWSLIASNAFTIVFGLLENVGVLSLLWVYWCQSVIIGFFNVLKILAAQGSDGNEITINGRKVASGPPWLKTFLAGFFVVHYGMFHFVYAVFLGIPVFFGAGDGFFGAGRGVDPNFVLLAALLFFGNHLYSFLANRATDQKKSPGELFMAPYSRIIPMHLTILFGGMLLFLGPLGNKLVFLLFSALKTLADVSAHVQEHAARPPPVNDR